MNPHPINHADDSGAVGGGCGFQQWVDPRSLARGLVRRTGRLVMRWPALARAVKPHLKRHSRLWERLKQIVLYEQTVQPRPERFIEIALGDLLLLFSDGPLADQRGIGRVARNLLTQLECMSRNAPAVIGPEAKQPLRPVRFYASIHWCPQTLRESTVIMIHDVIPLLFPQTFPAATVKAWNERYRRIAQQARCIVTISASSADDIARLLEIPRERIYVIHNGATRLSTDRRATARLPDMPYLVFVGSHDHHKNVDVVLHALAQPSGPQVRLLMIGDNGGCRRRVKELGLERRVQFLGRLRDEEIARVIAGALALVFPSLYEGFGLPPIEAALLGTPSICSRRPAMTELLDGGCLFADPHEPQEWAAQIARLLDEPATRTALAAKARAVAGGYTWERAAARLVGVLHHAT